jgi:hypothetical protein
MIRYAGATPMRLNTKSMFARLVNPLKRIETAIVGFVRHRVEVRRRRLELEEEFYRNLKKHYSASNMPIMWEDDWRMQR